MDINKLIQSLDLDMIPLSRDYRITDPLVSFLVPTYGRAPDGLYMLNEVLYWFHRQTYPYCEMVILNDTPGQTLKTDCLGVRIINCPERISSLGMKRNLLIMAARGEICLPWDDDDISLPWRAEQAVGMLKEHEYWNPRLWWYSPVGQRPVADGKGVGHNCSAYRRGAMFGKYVDINKCEDSLADAYAQKHLAYNYATLTNPDDICYFYRWGVSPRHLSAIQPDMEAAYREMPAGAQGEFEIYPQIGKDYLKIHEELIKLTS